MKNWSFSETEGNSRHLLSGQNRGQGSRTPPPPKLCLRASQSQVVLCLTLVMSTTNRAPARHLVSTNV